MIEILENKLTKGGLLKQAREDVLRCRLHVLGVHWHVGTAWRTALCRVYPVVHE